MVHGGKQDIYTPKMQAKNYQADIIGINLEYALETYEWRNLYPMTENGVTVTGFWDKRRDARMPDGYAMDGSGRFLVLDVEKIKLQTHLSTPGTRKDERS